MHDEYISREAAIEAVKHAWAKGLEPSQYIEILPAADVTEVRHGRWIYHDDGVFTCSECGTQNLTTAIIADYVGRRWTELPNERAAV